jgi:glycyl-tRNA synthetase alpha subunit
MQFFTTKTRTTAWTDICSCNICISHVPVGHAGGRAPTVGALGAASAPAHAKYLHPCRQRRSSCRGHEENNLIHSIIKNSVFSVSSVVNLLNKYFHSLSSLGIQCGKLQLPILRSCHCMDAEGRATQERLPGASPPYSQSRD